MMRHSILIFAGVPILASAAFADQITPGNGQIADAQGNTWVIDAGGGIKENGQWTPGGGGTSALEIINGSVYGLDAHGRGWFTLSSDGQYWATSSPPPDVTPGTSQIGASKPSTPNNPAGATGTVTAEDPGIPCSTQAAFGILPLQDGSAGYIRDSQGHIFVPRGVGVMEGQEASASDLQARFPGINLVRYAIFDYASPDQLADYVNQLTSAGIMVEIEDHQNNAGGAGGSQGVIFSGSMLQNELAWYSAIAAYFKSNPYVIFGTNNEPSETNSSKQNDPAGLSQWQLQTYQAIRNAGNDAIVLLELNGWGDPSSMGQGYDPSAYAQMYNVAWDMHYYGWLTNYSTDQDTNNAFIAAAVKQAQTFTSSGGAKIPVLIGEYGDSTTGHAIDANGTQAVQAVQQAVMDGTVIGSAAWAWTTGNPGDGLLAGGGLSQYGQRVASYIQTPVSNSATAAAAGICQSTKPGTVVAQTSDVLSQDGSMQNQPTSATQPAADNNPPVTPQQAEVSDTLTQAQQTATQAATLDAATSGQNETSASQAGSILNYVQSVAPVPGGIAARAGGQ